MHGLWRTPRAPVPPSHAPCAWHARPRAGTFTLIQSRAAALYGGAPDFSTLQSGLAVAQYAGSFLGVVVTAQLRGRTGSFVHSFALLPLLGFVSCLHCRRLFPVGGPVGSSSGRGRTATADATVEECPRDAL